MPSTAGGYAAVTKGLISGSFFIKRWASLPYLTLPYGEDVLPPSAEAANGPNAHPRINRNVTKSSSAVLTWVHTNTRNHSPPRREPTHLYLLTNMYSWYLQENISSKAHKTHISWSPWLAGLQTRKPGCLLQAHPVY